MISTDRTDADLVLVVLGGRRIVRLTIVVQSPSVPLHLHNCSIVVLKSEWLFLERLSSQRRYLSTGIPPPKVPSDTSNKVQFSFTSYSYIKPATDYFSGYSGNLLNHHVIYRFYNIPQNLIPNVPFYSRQYAMEF